MKSDLCDRHEYNPDPNYSDCNITGLTGPGVTFRGLSPAEMFYNQLFVGEVALHEAIAEFHGLDVNEVHWRLAEDEKSKSGQIKKLKADNATLTNKLAVWLDFKRRAEDAGLVVNL